MQNAVTAATELSGQALDESQMVRAGGLEPPRAYAQRIFIPATAFAAVFETFVVWTIPSPYDGLPRLGAARLVSTPSLMGEGLARDWHRRCRRLSFPRI